MRISPCPEAAGPTPFTTRFADVLGTTMAYWDEGEGDPIVLLHGNPTSKLLWRDVVPHLAGLGRVVVPDLVGMGESAKLPGTGDDRYRFVEHRRYLWALLAQLGVTSNVTLVLHDWGGGLGFDWARNHADDVRGIAFTETVCGLVSLADWPEQARDIFAAMRSDAGESIVLHKNVFVERILPSSVLGDIPPAVEAAYRAPYLTPGEDRRPTLTWPRQIPFDGEPSDVAEIVGAYEAWLGTSDVPKLHLAATPGFLTQVYGERIRRWPAVTEVPIDGIHFVQEDSADTIGMAVASWLSELD
ncbi:MAG: haloalkane dehalogenase [Nitriliruptoraceae bacterium]